MGRRMSNMTIGNILRNNVKEKLARDEVVSSMTVRLVRQMEIAQIAKTAGFDTIYVDMEHCSASIETTSQICMAALAAGIAPFVRVPANTPEYITRVLEGGALGVIAPHIGSVEGIDMVMIGTNDLLCDWGIPEQYEHPKVRQAYETTIAACRRHGKHVGVGGLATRPKLVEEYVRMGARYVSTGTDLAFLMGACAAKAKHVREIAL